MVRKRLVERWLAVSLAVLLSLHLPFASRAEETEAQRAARVGAMTAEQKQELLGKQARFQGLKPAEQGRLRELHEAITSDPNANHLEDTVRRYSQWLTNLSSPQRAAVLSIADPKDRIAKIKELIQQQEEQRFRQFAQEQVSGKDRDIIYAWLGDFILQHESAIRERMPQSEQRRLDDLDEAGRRRLLIGSWQMQVWRREAPTPSNADYEQLLVKLSEETRKQINAKPDERMRRLGELVRAAVASRLFAAPSRDELQKFYVGMKPEDPRREKLEGLEGDDLHRELVRMFNDERYGRRGGFGTGGQRGGGRGGPGPGGPGRGGDGPPGDFRPSGKGKGGPGKGGDGRDEHRGDGQRGEGQRPPTGDGTRSSDGPPGVPPPPTGELPPQP